MHKLALSINGTPIPAPDNIPTGGLSGDGGKILGFGIDIFLTLAIILALGFLMWGGINWITSQGDKTKIESARRTIIFAVIGLLICFVSFFIAQAILQTFGVDLFKLSL